MPLDEISDADSQYSAGRPTLASRVLNAGKKLAAGALIASALMTAPAVASSYNLIPSYGYSNIVQDVGVTSASFAAGDYFVAKRNKEKYGLEELAESTAKGMAMGTFLNQGLKPFNELPSGRTADGFLKRNIAGFGLLNPFFVATYQAANYLIKNSYTPYNLVKGLFTGRTWKLPYIIYKDVYKKEFIPSLRDSMKYLGLPLVYIWNFLPASMIIPASAALNFAFSVIMSKKKKPDKG